MNSMVFHGVWLMICSLWLTRRTPAKRFFRFANSYVWPRSILDSLMWNSVITC